MLCLIPAYIYVRGEFYNEASNLQIAIREARMLYSAFSKLMDLAKFEELQIKKEYVLYFIT